MLGAPECEVWGRRHPGASDDANAGFCNHKRTTQAFKASPSAQMNAKNRRLVVDVESSCSRCCTNNEWMCDRVWPSAPLPKSSGKAVGVIGIYKTYLGSSRGGFQRTSTSSGTISKSDVTEFLRLSISPGNGVLRCQRDTASAGPQQHIPFFSFLQSFSLELNC